METIKIGKQIWSMENLDVDHYRNGDVIPQVQNKKDWANLTTGAWCYYDNDSENGKKHGKLYNWYAVNDKRGLAPEGFHIPNKKEFEILQSTVNNDGNSLKAVGEGEGDGIGTNKSKFSALLLGCRCDNGSFIYLGYATFYWCITAHNEMYAYGLSLYYSNSGTKLDIGSKEEGFSVRVVENKGL